MPQPRLEDTDVIILAGGKGTRLGTAGGNAPKVMAMVGGEPFLMHIVTRLKRQGARTICMAVGHKSNQVMEYFGDGSDLGLSIRYSVETAPLGTGGAIRQAIEGSSKTLHVIQNGDSFVEVDYASLLAFHHGKRADLSMTLVELRDVSRFGAVEVDEKQRVRSFSEKPTGAASTLVNAGVYVTDGDVLGKFPLGERLSLENDMMPSLLHLGVYGYRCSGYFIDIGVPADYESVRCGFPEGLL